MNENRIPDTFLMRKDFPTKVIYCDQSEEEGFTADDWGSANPVHDYVWYLMGVYASEGFLVGFVDLGGKEFWYLESGNDAGGGDLVQVPYGVQYYENRADGPRREVKFVTFDPRDLVHAVLGSEAVPYAEGDDKVVAAYEERAEPFIKMPEREPYIQWGGIH